MPSEKWMEKQQYTQWTSWLISRFWHFYLIEACWLVALSVILIGDNVWLVSCMVA